MKTVRERTSAALAVRGLLASLLLGALLCAGPQLQVAVAQSGPGVKEDMGIYPEPSPPPPLPAPGGKLIDPTFGTEILRATGPSDCADPGCSDYYSHWPTFNLDNTKLLIRNGATGLAILKDFDPVNFTVGAGKTNLPNTIQDSNCTNCTGTSTGPEWESAIWSNIYPNLIFTFPSWYTSNGALRLYSYDILTGKFTQLADLNSANEGHEARFAQMYMSVNDDVFCWLQKRPDSVANPWGFTVYKHSTGQILFNEPDIYDGEINEVHVDKSGKWLHVVIPTVQPDGTGTRILNLQTGQYQPMVKSVDRTPGHGDLGTETIVGFNEYEGGLTARNLSDVHAFQQIFEFITLEGDKDWTKDFHGTLLADNEEWITIGTYVEWGSIAGGNTNYHLMDNEIVQIATDGSRRVRRLAHTHSIIAPDTTQAQNLSGITPKPSNGYRAKPQPTISKDGKYIAFNSNWGNSDRYDLFILKVPPAAGLPPTAPTSAAFSGYDLVWTDNSNTETGFRIERRTSSGSVWTTYYQTSANVMRYTIPTADAQANYFRVRAFNAAGASAPTNEVTKPPQPGPNSLSLNGTGAYALAPDSDSLDLVGGGVTVEAWVKYNTNGNHQTFVSKEALGQVGGGGGYQLGITNTGKPRLVIWTDYNAYADVVGATTLSPGVWHHIAGVADGSQRRVYLDGKPDGTATGAQLPTAGNGAFNIGRRGNNTYRVNGLVDEVRVSNAALYTGEFTPETGLTAGASTKGLWKFDGQTANDFSANANHATLQSGAIYSAEVPVASAYSLLLNGTSAYALVGDTNNSLDLAGSSITVEAWIKYNTNGNHQTFVSKESLGQVGGGGGYQLGITNTGKARFVIWTDYNAYVDVVGVTTLTPGVWHHVAGVADGTQRRIYVDGVMNGSVAGAQLPTAGSGAFNIGRRGNNTYRFNGRVDELRVSNAALYTSNFTPATSLTGSASTKGLWKFNNQTADDGSGNGNHGTLQGGAVYSTDVP